MNEEDISNVDEGEHNNQQGEGNEKKSKEDLLNEVKLFMQLWLHHAELDLSRISSLITIISIGVAIIIGVIAIKMDLNISKLIFLIVSSSLAIITFF